MTSPASTPLPHSRWLVRETCQPARREPRRCRRRHLGAERRRSGSPRPYPAAASTAHCRATGLATDDLGRSGARGSGVVLDFVSIRLVARLAPLPVFVAAVPGVLLTAAVAGAARYQTRTIKRLEKPGITKLLPPSIPLAAASAGVIAWVALWLVLTSSTPVWSAVTFAIVLTMAAAVARDADLLISGNAPDYITPSSGVSARIRSEPPAAYAFCTGERANDWMTIHASGRRPLIGTPRRSLAPVSRKRS